MNEKDRREVLDLIASDRNRAIEQEWPKRLEWFMCPECKTQTLAMKFIPKSKFPVTYGFVEMNTFTMTGRQCIICKKRFVPGILQPPKDDYIEEV